MRFTAALRCANKRLRLFSEAERLVGYSNNSFLSLQCLLSDEVSRMVLNVRKLLGTGHPILKSIRHFLQNGGKNGVHIRGLIVLLLSRAANNRLEDSNSQNSTDLLQGGIYQSQRSLAEITELIYIANAIHKDIMDQKEMQSTHYRNLAMGNSLSVLGGDFLLANASVALAQLGNQQVIHAMAQSIADMTESEFIDNSKSLSNWTRKALLSSASLLANASWAALELKESSRKLKDSAYQFSLNVAMAYRIREDLARLNGGAINGWDINTSIFASMITTPSTIDISKAVINQPSLIEEANWIMMEHRTKALEELQHFPASEATETLERIAQLS